MSLISEIRRDYTQAGLDVDDLTSQPFALFERWLQNAVDANLTDPTAMTVATVDNQGQPSQRSCLPARSSGGCQLVLGALASARRISRSRHAGRPSCFDERN